MFASCQKARNDDTCSECLTQIGLEIHLKQLHVGIKFLFFHLKLINEETFFGNKRWKICTGKHFRNTMRLHSISLNFFLQYFQVGKIFYAWFAKVCPSNYWLLPKLAPLWKQKTKDFLPEIEMVKNELRPQKLAFSISRIFSP